MAIKKVRMNYKQVVTEYFTNRLLQILQQLPGNTYLGKEVVKHPCDEEVLRVKCRALINKKFLHNGSVR